MRRLSPIPKNIPAYPKNILIVRPHNQVGDQLAASPLFRALKTAFPKCTLTLVASPANAAGAAALSFGQKVLLYDKKKLYQPKVFFSFQRELRKGYDWVLVPAVVSLSTTACWIARAAKAAFRIGPASLGAQPNPYARFFDLAVPLEAHETSTRHVGERIQDLLRPLGLFTKDLRPSLSVSRLDQEEAARFLSAVEKKTWIIGVHAGAGKPQNRWPPERFAEVLNRLQKRRKCFIYFTGTQKDLPGIEAIEKSLPFSTRRFLEKSLTQTAALIQRSHLFLTNDTALMHVGAAVPTPQVSLFGPTSPQHWAPRGKRKIALRKGNTMHALDAATVEAACLSLLKGQR